METETCFEPVKSFGATENADVFVSIVKGSWDFFFNKKVQSDLNADCDVQDYFCVLYGSVRQSQEANC